MVLLVEAFPTERDRGAAIRLWPWAFGQHLLSIKNIAFTRIQLDQVIPAVSAIVQISVNFINVRMESHGYISKSFRCD